MFESIDWNVATVAIIFAVFLAINAILITLLGCYRKLCDIDKTLKHNVSRTESAINKLNVTMKRWWDWLHHLKKEHDEREAVEATDTPREE